MLAYFWMALGLAEAAQLEAVVAGHAQQAILIDASDARELLVHHLGHHDGHEPHAGVCAQDTHGCVVDADHVIKLGDDDALSGPLAKSTAVAKVLALAASTCTIPLPAVPAVRSRQAVFAPSTRNSSTASVKLARLRI